MPTEENGLLGSSFEDYSYYFPEWIEPTAKPQVIEHFQSIEEAMNASHIKIQDFLYEYTFGDVIGVLNSAYNYDTLFENYSKCRIWIFGILAFSTNFCPIKIDLSGNTVWPQASGFQKLAKIDHFLAFLINFCPLKL